MTWDLKLEIKMNPFVVGNIQQLSYMDLYWQFNCSKIIKSMIKAKTDYQCLL